MRPINRSILISIGLALASGACLIAALAPAGLCSPSLSCPAAGLALAAAFLAIAQHGRAAAREVCLLAEIERQKSAAQAARREQEAVAARSRELELALKLARAERKAGEDELAHMKNEFTSMVSHELRTPLASIKAYVEMLIDGEAPDAATQREFYDVIQNEANRLGRLIDNVLNISRIEAGLVRVRREPLGIVAVLQDAIDTIAPHARQKRIEIEATFPDVSREILADRDMLYQAAVNLLSNAIKYTPEGGAVRVETSVDESRKVIRTRISDTGVGIPPKDLPFVFDKFYRAEANNRIAPGTGLGLSLVRHIVETVHGGRISVESRVGRGSTFAFELDLVASESLLCC